MIIVLDHYHRPIANAAPWEIAAALHVSTEEVMQKAAEGGRLGCYWLEPTEAYIDWLDTLMSNTLPLSAPVLTIDEVAQQTGNSWRTTQTYIAKFKRRLHKLLLRRIADGA